MRVVSADDADALRLVHEYFDELRLRLGAFEAPSDDELLADGASGAVLVAYDGDDRAVACAWLRRLTVDAAEVKRMYVVPRSRGRGTAKKLLVALEDRARALGCARVMLDTAAPLVEAAELYLRAGYAEIERYNDNPYAARWFSKAV